MAEYHKSKLTEGFYHPDMSPCILMTKYLIDKLHQLDPPQQYEKEAANDIEGGQDPRWGEHRRAHPAVHPCPVHAIHLGGQVDTPSQEDYQEVDGGWGEPLKPKGMLVSLGWSICSDVQVAWAEIWHVLLPFLGYSNVPKPTIWPDGPPCITYMLIKGVIKRW